MAVHLIETSEEDSYLAVARHVSDLLNEGEVSRRRLHQYIVLHSHLQLFPSAVLCLIYRDPALKWAHCTQAWIDKPVCVSAGPHSPSRHPWVALHAGQRGRIGRRQIWGLAESVGAKL